MIIKIDGKQRREIMCHLHRIFIEKVKQRKVSFPLRFYQFIKLK